MSAKFHLITTALFLFATYSEAIADPIPLTLGPRSGLEIAHKKGIWTLDTTGKNPHVWTSKIPASASLGSHPILSFDYFSVEPIPNLRIRVPGAEKPAQLSAGTIPFSETWKTHGIDLRLCNRRYISGEHFALLLGTRPGHTFQVRNIRLRKPNTEEQRSAAERDRVLKIREADGDRYLTYLDNNEKLPPLAITVGQRDLTFTGRIEAEALQLTLAEVPIHIPSHHAMKHAIHPRPVKTKEDGSFEASFPRFEGPRDRSLSRWILLSSEGEALSAATYPTAYASEVARKIPKLIPEGFKGLGGIPALTSPDHEIFDLNIHNATVNIVVSSILSPEKGPGRETWNFEGTTYFLNRNYLNRIDNNVRILTERETVVSAILLVGNGRDKDGNPNSPMVHPEGLIAGRFAMPDLKTEEGSRLYRAVIHLLTERYTRENSEHGRITNWIMHNEIDQSGTWTTMGEQPLSRYLETFIRSARLVHHSARRFDPHARIFVSLTHHWMKQSGGPQTFIVRDIIDLFARASRIEGDYDWGIAYHPYPESLFEPRTWEDDVTYDFDTEYITPKNIEVLPAYLDREPFRFQGKNRGILLSEQGINAPSLSDEDQKLQAAGIAYTIYRVRQIPQIEAFHYHAYRDAPEAEGGLLLGLTNPNYGHKFSWDIYAAIGTDQEEEVTQFAWPIIGVESPDAFKLRDVSH